MIKTLKLSERNESFESLKIKTLKIELKFTNYKLKFLKTPQNSRSSNFDPLYTGGG